MSRSTRNLLLVLSTGALVSGCKYIPPADGQGPQPEPVNNYVERPSTTQVSGFAYDPEAYLYSLVTWPFDPGCTDPECEPPGPELFAPNPHLERASIPLAGVTIIDGMTGEPAGSTESTETGLFGPLEIPSSQEGVVYTATEGGVFYDPGADFGLPPIPPATTHVPTLNLRPIYPYQSYCWYQQAVALGDSGILDAVARILTEYVAPTTVEDLLDPEQWGGVFVAMVLSPDPDGASLNVTEGGTDMQASTGMVLPIDWVPPDGEGYPPELEAILSPRGFFVNDEFGTAGWLGMFVVLVDPGETEPLIVQPVDLADPDPEMGRPWVYPEMQVDFLPGMVSYANIHAFLPEMEGEGGDEGPVGVPDFTWLCN